MNIKNIRKNFYNENPNAIAYFWYNEKLKKYVCFTFDVYKSSNNIFNETAIKNISENAEKSGLDPLSAVVQYIEIYMPDFYEKFSDFYADEYIDNSSLYKDTQSLCSGINKYISNSTSNQLKTSKNSKISAYLVEKDGEIDKNSIFTMDLSFKKINDTKTCYIENTFTDLNYRKVGLHGMSIKFLESVLASRNIYSISGKSQACDVYESEDSSTLETHYKKLGFDVDKHEDGTYSIFKCVDPNLSLDNVNEYELTK